LVASPIAEIGREPNSYQPLILRSARTRAGRAIARPSRTVQQARVSKDEAGIRASWLETHGVAVLLTMRV
jgi:hypothetical protein